MNYNVSEINVLDSFLCQLTSCPPTHEILLFLASQVSPLVSLSIVVGFLAPVYTCFCGPLGTPLCLLVLWDMCPLAVEKRQPCSARTPLSSHFCCSQLLPFTSISAEFQKQYYEMPGSSYL